MKWTLVALMTCMSVPALAKVTVFKTEVVEEQMQTEEKTFCSKSSEKDAAAQCEHWLDRQTKSLGQRLLTSDCSVGDMTADANCLYKAKGTLKFALKKYRTETEHD